MSRLRAVDVEDVATPHDGISGGVERFAAGTVQRKRGQPNEYRLLNKLARTPLHAFKRQLAKIRPWGNR